MASSSKQKPQIRYDSATNYARSMREVLDMEREAEHEQSTGLLVLPKDELVARGVAVVNLKVDEVSIGLYGRTIVDFTSVRPMGKEDSLPNHKCSSGSIVGVFDGNHPISPTGAAFVGTVSQVKPKVIQVMFDDTVEFDEGELSGRIHLCLLGSNVTFNKNQGALKDLESGAMLEWNSSLQNVCFGLSEPRFHADLKAMDSAVLSKNNIRWSNGYADEGTPFEELPEVDQMKRLWMHEKTGELNLPQQRAVKQALSALDLGLIHGPPGTGKTTTIVQLIAEFVSRGLRCIIAAPSNIAVDNMLERCAAIGVKGLCRLGHPVRMQDAIKKYSLEALVFQSEEFKLCQDVRKELQETFKKKKKLSKAEFIKLKAERSALRKELKAREKTAVTRVLKSHGAIFCTCSGAAQMLKKISRGKDHLEYIPPFDVAIVDEAGQGTEVQTWLPLLAAGKSILAGDHKQLGATVLSEDAVSCGMQLSLFQRMQDLHGDKISTLLSIQYRMNDKIMQWSSDQFYHGNLTAHESCAKGTLAKLLDEADVQSELLKLRDSVFTESMNTEIFLDIAKHPFVFCDTTGCDWAHEDVSVETVAGVQESKGNQGEANCVLQYVKLLIGHGISPDNINVITPYNKQVQVIRKLTLSDENVDLLNLRHIQINTVDSFQGRENDVVVLSLVRSNHGNNVGFLADERRLNVAVTRAKKHVFVIGNAETISKTKVLKSMTDYAEANGFVFSAEMLANDECMELAGPAPTSAPVASASVKPSEPKPSKVSEKSGAGGGKNKKKPGQKGHAGDSDSKPRPKKNEPSDKFKEEVTMKLELLATNPDKNAKLEFPKSFNPSERFSVHEIAETMKLFTQSQGEGDDRFVVVYKRDPDTKSEVSIPEYVPPKDRPQESSEISLKNQNEVEYQTSASSKQPPASKAAEKSTSGAPESEEKKEELSEGNKLLQQLAKEKAERKAAADKKRRDAIQAEERARKAEKMKRKKENKEKKKNGGYPDTKTDVNDDDDFDAILADAQQTNKTCFFQGCNKSVVMLKSTCPHCLKVFCLTHAQAEMHGCGDAARTAARKEWIDGGVKKMVGTVKKPGTTPARSQLQKNLNKKLEGAKEQRTAKAKPKKKK
eukprot:gene339-716_t